MKYTRGTGAVKQKVDISIILTETFSMKIDSETLLVELLATTNAIWAASRPFFETFDISDAQFNLLNLLAQAKEPTSQRELAEQLLTDKSAVTGLVDRMERKDLIRRKAAPHDRRVYHIELTPKGLALWKKVRPIYLKEVEQLFAKIPQSQRDALLKQLGSVKEYARQSWPANE